MKGVGADWKGGVMGPRRNSSASFVTRVNRWSRSFSDASARRVQSAPFVSSPRQKQLKKKKRERSLALHHAHEEVHTEGSGDEDGGI